MLQHSNLLGDCFPLKKKIPQKRTAEYQMMSLPYENSFLCIIIILWLQE